MGRKSVEIKVSADVLKALRESSGYIIEEVAKELRTSEEKVKAVEAVLDA